MKVSIHTPTQGVTLFFLPQGNVKLVSIHTPTQGVTLDKYSVRSYLCAGFNPHTHAGCDNPQLAVELVYQVSIHTPTQGVTFTYSINILLISFNPHTHAGCDCHIDSQ